MQPAIVRGIDERAKPPQLFYNFPIVEPLPVLSISYSQESHGPWPRILKILAVVAIAFGALRMAATGFGLRSFGSVATTFRSIYSWNWIAFGLDLALNALLAAGGLRLLMRPGSYRLLLVAGWLWCILTALGLGFQTLVALITSGMIGYLPMSILYGTSQAVFPVVIILLLSEFRKAQQISPQPIVPPAFKRWPGQS
jgi:hypothetical protein